MSDRVLRLYQRAASYYDWLDAATERAHHSKTRPQAFAGLTGRILDAGVGTGRNMPFYPAAAEVTGIDQSPAMLARARARSERLGRPVRLERRDLLRTGFADGAFDAVVATFVFAVLEQDEQPAVLAELRRICAPRGEVRLVDYVLPARGARRLSARLTGPLARLAFGARLDPRPEGYAAAAGLEVVEERFLLGDFVRMLRLRPKNSAGAEPVRRARPPGETVP